MRKFLIVVGVLLLGFFIVKNPIGAAHAAKSLGSGLLAVANGFIAFATAATS